MRRLMARFLVLVMLLCGCAKVPEETQPTLSETTTEPSQTTAPTEPTEDPYDGGPHFEAYEPDSQIQVDTQGAVRAYPLDGVGYVAVEMMGEGILLFSGGQETTLTLWQEDKEPVSVTLDKWILPTQNYCVIGDDRIGYYDDVSRELVMLDDRLSQIQRIAMPEDMVGEPMLTEDLTKAYYFDQEYLRCMELESGICRILTNARWDRQRLVKTHFNDTLLECRVVSEGENSTLMIDASNGQTVYNAEYFPELQTEGDWYFAERFEAQTVQYLFGGREEEPQCLVPEIGYDGTIPVPEKKSSLFYREEESSYILDLYDTVDGTRCSSLLIADAALGDIAYDAGRGLFWIVTDLEGSQVLLSWDPELSLTGETESYIDAYYTAEDPDAEGLARIADQAKALGDSFGVRLLVYTDATKYMPSDYTFQAEHRVTVYEHFLPILEDALGAYPEGFLKRLGTSSGNGRLTVSLVMGAYGDNDLGALSQADGVQFWSDGNAYLTLVMNDLVVGTLYHELYHIIDTYILTETQAFDFWDGLNPEGFRYDNDYLENQYREDGTYLEDENRYFIDTYSMSFAKEDRARIIEYAMQEGNEAYFTSDAMQAKLRTICKGIREAFSLKKSDKVFLWEQYLKEPLVP